MAFAACVGLAVLLATPEPPPIEPVAVVVEAVPTGPSIESLLAAGNGVTPRAIRPRVVVVIDDLGHDVEAARQAVSLPPEIVLAFLPYPAASPAMARLARARGHEVLLHMPMAAERSNADPGPDALVFGLAPDELRRRLVAALLRVPGAIGVNNHMGSGITADSAAMAVVMAELADRGLFFLDSVTTARTVAGREAIEAGVPWARRDVFLDNDSHVWAIEVQLQALEAAALRDGIAIGIGHPHHATLAALGPWAKGLAARGFDLVTLATVVRRTDTAVAEVR